MAIFHFSGEVIGRKKVPGATAAAAAAYRSGEQIGEHDYTKKGNVGWSGMLFPSECPERLRSREALWTEVDKVEKRKDAQLYRSFDFAFPNSFSLQDCKEVVTVFAADQWVSKGMCADLSIHCNPGNLHGHAMLTLRSVSEDGFGNKNREWNEHELMEQWRLGWENAVNERLRLLQSQERIDRRSYKRRGLDLEPTSHLGRFRAFLERQGEETILGRLNRLITARNAEKMRSFEFVLGKAERVRCMDNEARKAGAWRSDVCYARMDIDLQKQIDELCGTDYAKQEMIRRHNARLEREKSTRGMTR